MRIPIAYALNYPRRLDNKVQRLNLTQQKNLEFCKPDMNKFRCLKLAYEAGLAGGTNPAVLNAANEVAVAAFLDKKIGFTDIEKIIAKILSMHDAITDPSLEEILAADGWAREKTRIIIERNKD
jgi:1-deoxy-D-xylulose-5-phosphate reductoisomerase